MAGTSNGLSDVLHVGRAGAILYFSALRQNNSAREVVFYMRLIYNKNVIGMHEISHKSVRECVDGTMDFE